MERQRNIHAWVGDGIRREVFLFSSNERPVYGSLYAPASSSPAAGVVVCNSWGFEGDQSSKIAHLIGLSTARAGGATFIFHYPGFGDSQGDIAESTMSSLADTAVDALRDASHRFPETAWSLAGLMFGASIASLAAQSAPADRLLLVQPALKPSGYFSRLQRSARRNTRNGSAHADNAYGYPLPRRILADLAGADSAVATALQEIEMDGAVLRYAKPPRDDLVPNRFADIIVDGTWRFGSRQKPEFVAPVREWLLQGSDDGDSQTPAPTAPPAPRTPSLPSEAVTDHPAILSTSVGPVGAILTMPSESPKDALILMQGGGDPCRAGVNGGWAQLARDLAERGIAVLRFDFIREGDSMLAGESLERKLGWRRNADLAITREMAAWLRERVGIVDLLVAGSCHGGRLALDFAAEDPHVKRSFLIVPYLSNLPPHLRPDKQAAKSLFLPRAREMFDRNSTNIDVHKTLAGEVEAVADVTPLEQSIVDACAAALERGGVSILIGEGDSQKPVSLKERLGPSASGLDVEVIPGTILHPVTHPEVQELVSGRLRAWASGAAERASASPGWGGGKIAGRTQGTRDPVQ